MSLMCRVMEQHFRKVEQQIVKEVARNNSGCLYNGTIIKAYLNFLLRANIPFSFVIESGHNHAVGRIL